MGQWQGVQRVLVQQKAGKSATEQGDLSDGVEAGACICTRAGVITFLAK